MRIVAAALAFFLLTSCSAYRVPKHATWKNTTSVEQMERLYWQAIKDKDWMNVEAHTASAYTHVAADGVKSKQEILDFYKGLDLLEYSLGEFQVTDHAGTTTVSYLANASFEAGGQRTTARFRVLSVWQQQKNGWAMIANSTTAIQ